MLLFGGCFDVLDQQRKLAPYDLTRRVQLVNIHFPWAYDSNEMPASSFWLHLFSALSTIFRILGFRNSTVEIPVSLAANKVNLVELCYRPDE